MALFARLICYPPLSQVTVVPPRREGVSYLRLKYPTNRRDWIENRSFVMDL